jgi:hypothetical protein
MDVKKIAMILAITVLLPLFVGLFTDAVYQQPKYEKFCNSSLNSYPQKAIPASPVNCTFNYGPQQDQCYSAGGQPEFNYTDNGCQVYVSCNMCSKYFNDATQKYNRNIFFILLPVGLIVVILGLYLVVDYLGAGLMFAGLIVMFYATFRYFSDMSKMLRALVILIELLVIMWIGYKKMEDNMAVKVKSNIKSEKINKSKLIKKR